jgi:hypothetical protein
MVNMSYLMHDHVGIVHLYMIDYGWLTTAC